MNTAQEFVDALNAQVKANGKTYSFELKVNRKFDKVIATDYGSRSAYCFIDKEGNIYKTAGWNAPAKGIRAIVSKLTAENIAAICSHGYASTNWLYR